MSSLKPIRRLIAGNNAAGESTVLLDGGAYAVQGVEICAAQPPALVFTERPVPALTLTPPLRCREPPAATPQVWRSPALMDRKTRPPETATGLVRVLSVPSPSRPLRFKPQQYAAPSEVIPQV